MGLRCFRIMAIQTYTVEQQRDFLRHLSQSRYRLMARLNRKAMELEKLARHRAIEIGIPQYGDATFHKTMDQLKYETDCELADGIVYQRIYELKDKGIIP
jgi:hypothetical protein